MVFRYDAKAAALLKSIEQGMVKKIRQDTVEWRADENRRNEHESENHGFHFTCLYAYWP